MARPWAGAQPLLGSIRRVQDGAPSLVTDRTGVFRDALSLYLRVWGTARL